MEICPKTRLFCPENRVRRDHYTAVKLGINTGPPEIKVYGGILEVVIEANTTSIEEMIM